MKDASSIVNEVLVDLFNDILNIEQKALSATKFKDLSIAEIHTIEAVSYEERTMSEVARNLKITTGTLTIAINNLVNKGYVKRKRNEDDRRVVLVSLTQSGKVVFRIHKKFHDDMVKATLEGLNNDEQEVLINSLSKLNKFFREKYKD
ncbi:MAG: MarR family winged helix-turn-helix transcriptional regulator [Bacillota bacterium]|nr:MarR family winged helix-turn-helix transcriptional regulator [Bacillota bacterium]